MEAYFDPKDLPKITKVTFKCLNVTRLILFILGGLLSLGLLWILSFWFPVIIDFIYTDEQELIRAEFIMFTTATGKREYVRLQKDRCRLLPHQREKFYMFFFYKGLTFYFSNSKMKFRKTKDNYLNYMKKKQPSIEDLSQGLTRQLYTSLHKLHGTNKISLKDKNVAKYFINQIFFPANFFQLLISLCFFLIGRKLYSVMVFCYVTMLITFKTYEYAVQIKKFKAISKSRDNVVVIRRSRSGKKVEKVIPAYQLSIGDVVYIQPEQKFPCDMALIEGSCLVNEAMLTGESTPVTKVAIEQKVLKQIDAKYLLYSGTFSIFNRSKRVKGLVIGTGWNTTKGQMLNAIAFNEELMLKFDRDFFVVLAFLFLINLTLIITLLAWELINDTFGWEKDGIKVLQFLKNGFPPSLYFITIASMQMSTLKLNKKEIGVLHMEKIVEGGGISTIAFDKTGTLTENTLKMFGFAYSDDGNFLACQNDLRNLVYYSKFREFLEIISCCHSLITFDGKLYGDPLDEVMFLASKSHMIIEEAEGHETYITRIGMAREFKQMFKYNSDLNMRIVHVHEFTADRRKMSVISHNEETDELTLLVKGAPESIKDICNPASIPHDFDKVLIKYSEEGYRTLALGYKRLKSSDLTFTQSKIIINNPTLSALQRGEAKLTDEVIKQVIDIDPKEIESDIIFVGLLLFENPIKETTHETIAELKQNYMRQLIITGDNLYTAINVAYTCGILEKDQDLIVGSINSSTNKIQLQELHADERIEISRKPKMGNLDIEMSAVSSHYPTVRRKLETGNAIDQILSTCQGQKIKLALEAKCFQYIHKIIKDDEERLLSLMNNTVVFGRASTEQKEMIVSVYKELLGKSNQCIAFVGDGSNDCRALKAANVGLSIGNDESSFAASFTSTRINISPIIDIIVEGKACLANAVQNFKFLMISNLMVCFGIYLLNYKKLSINQFDYLYSFIFSFPFAFFMTLGQSKKRLNCLRMEPTLLTKENLTPFIVHLALIFIFLAYTVYLLTEFQVYKTVEEVVGVYDPATFDVDNHFFVENKLIFFFMSTMMIVNATACYAGFPFKVPFYKNPFVVVYSVITVLFVIFNIFAESILDGYLLEFYVRRGRQPIYQPRQLKKFWLASGMVYFVIIFLNNIIDRLRYYKQLKAIKGLNRPMHHSLAHKDEIVINTIVEESNE